MSESQTTSPAVAQETVSKEHTESAQRTDTAEQPALTAPSEKHESSNDAKEKRTEETVGEDNSEVLHTVDNAADSTTNDT